MKLSRSLVAGALLAAALAALPAKASAQASETQVKAAFLPRFARYVTWPPSARPSAGQPFVLCVIGGDPFGRTLDRAASSQTADGHNVVVKRVRSASDADSCHIAYIHGSQADPTGQILAALGRRPILTVTDASNGSRRGIIHFAVASGRVRFFIDEAEAAERGIDISSRLLALAIAVRQR